MVFKWRDILGVAEKVVSVIMSIAPIVLNIFAPKAVPIVTALGPSIAKAVAFAEALAGNQSGQARAIAAYAFLAGLVDAGAVLSSGGQKHTMEELQAAKAQLDELFTKIISSADAVVTTAAADVVPVPTPTPVETPA